MKLIDLTHTLTENVPVFADQCDFQLRISKDYAESQGPVRFRVQHLQMTAGTATHIDAPLHIKPNGMGVDAIPIDTLLSPLIVIDVSKKADANYQVSAADVQGFESKHGRIKSGSFALIYTGWDRFWNTPTFRNELQFPSVSREAALLLLERGIVGLGTDTLSADCPPSGYPVHELVLGQDKYLLECVANAAKMPVTGAYILIAPLKLAGGAEAPARVFGLVI